MSDVKWGSDLSYLVYKRTYSRPTKEGSEEFTDTVSRILKACKTQLKLNFTQEEESELAQCFYDMKGMVAGRFLWQLGTKTVDKLGLLSLQNCAAVVVNEPVKPFTWAMDALMLGCGVGFNIQREHVYELPKVRKAKITRKDTKDADFIVPDSREGWVQLLAKTLKAHFLGGKGFSYSTICIRGRGTPIKGFGGTSSGPEILCEGIAKISEVLNKRAGKKVRPIDCLDIMNIIASIVVAGNVRRSAEISLGDYDDLQFLSAKDWSSGSIPNHRAMSNNSVICNDINDLPESFWDGYAGNGEPYGLINLKLSRSCGRLGETQYPDPDVVAYNPCAEQSLADYETCCLAELYLPNLKTLEEAKRIATYLYRINKHSLRLKCHHLDTQEIVHKHMRMGIGVTGYLQSTEEQKAMLPKLYKYLREYDAEYSAKMGWPPSIKITTVKPSGTLSLLAGVTPGVHPGYAQHYIRRIRMNSESPLVSQCREAGYSVEPQRNFDGTESRDTVVVSFPEKFPEGTVLAKDVTAIDQLEYVKRLQTDWSDNSVSCTVYYRKEELPLIKEWLIKHYNDSVKTVSFLLHSDHGFDQAPLEETTEKVYNEMIKKISPITSTSFKESDMEVDIECEGGACPVK